MPSLHEYAQFLRDKIKLAQRKGFDVSTEEMNPGLRPFTRDIVRWAIAGGQRAIFSSFGLHKTTTALEIMRLIGVHRPGLRLIVAPLGVRQEFTGQALQHFKDEFAIDVRFIRSDSEIGDERTIYLTNYESVRESKITVPKFRATSLDEAAVLRSYGSKTYQEFLPAFEPVEFKFVATATPSPNRFKELIHYAGYLGVMDTGQALTRFFQRDSEKAGNLTLYPHKTEEFWLWVASWAIFVRKPSDLCRCSCHSEKTSSAVNSANLPSTNGFQAPCEMEHGPAIVNAAGEKLQPLTTCSPEQLSVADASVPSMGERERLHMPHGAVCTTELSRTANTTPAEGLLCANAGTDSLLSSTISDNLHQEPHWTESTTIADMSLGTVDGQLGKSKPEIPGEMSELNLMDENRRSQHGPKNSASNIGRSTQGTALDGRQKGCCNGKCVRCAEWDEGYDLPSLDVRFHEVPSNYEAAGAEKNGQTLLIPNVAMGLSAAANEKRDSMGTRVAKVAELVADAPDDHFVIWHDLEDERHAIQAAVPGVVSVWGTQDLDEREERIVDFGNGKHRILSTKPIIAGAGCNFQRHCHREIFAGIGHKFHDFIQAIHREQRFQQPHPVRIDIVHTEVERGILADLMKKWRQHDAMQDKMSEIIRTYGLDQLSMQDSLARTIGVERRLVEGKLFSVANNDCVLEAKQYAENSVGMICTSIPFANHYEYSPSYNDFGHTQDNAHFWAQMDFLTPELLRILQPGRIYACHVKDRINFGNVTGAGVPTVSPFHAEALFHGIKHGFDYLGMITVITDVVRENNQTYRLGYSEVCKDGSKMGVGSPEYILIFHKPQTDRSRGYADVPVTKTKPLCLADDGTAVPFDRKLPPIPGTGYSVARWQVDAHAYWRTSGDRLIGAKELANFGPARLAKMFTDLSLANVYNYEYHVQVGEALLANKALPADYMSLAPGSTHPMVWHDIVRMRTLNGDQAARAVEKHVCPFQIDLVDRLINRYSNPGDVIYDPFCGLGTVPVRAMKLGRLGAGSELNAAYFADQVHYCKAMGREVSIPTLFDWEALDAEAAA